MVEMESGASLVLPDLAVVPVVAGTPLPDRRASHGCGWVAQRRCHCDGRALGAARRPDLAREADSSRSPA